MTEEVVIPENLGQTLPAVRYPDQPRRPYLCPVCRGRGDIEEGFYTRVRPAAGGDTKYADCRSCGGTGIVWGG